MASSESERRANIAPELAAKIERVQQQYPDYCESNLSSFVASAVRRYIWSIRRQAALDAIAQGSRSGSISPEVAALMLPDEVDEP